MVGGSGPVRSDIADHPIRETEGKGIYLQGGFYFPDWQVQPWASYEGWYATGKFGRWSAFRVGLTYFFKGQNANIKLGYERVDTVQDIGNSSTDNSGKDNINTFVLGLYLSF